MKISAQDMVALIPFVKAGSELALTAVQMVAMWNAGITTEMMVASVHALKQETHHHANNSQMTDEEKAAVARHREGDRS